MLLLPKRIKGPTQPQLLRLQQLPVQLLSSRLRTAPALPATMLRVVQGFRTSSPTAFLVSAAADAAAAVLLLLLLTESAFSNTA
jgi:hypothetical protein